MQSSQYSSGNEQVKKKPDFRHKDPLKTSLRHLILNNSDTQYQIVEQAAQKLGFLVSQQEEAVDWDIYWTDNYIDQQLLMSMHQHQKVSHLPGVQYLTRKNLMGKTLMHMKRDFPEQYDFFPLTWMLPSQLNQFRLYYQAKVKGRTRTYIVKPQGGCQGRGIFLTREIQQIGRYQRMVVQRYISKPLLIDGLKFDLRLYVLLTCLNPIRIYLYKQGLARFATKKFQPPKNDNLKETYIHMTNYAINKANPSFVPNRSQKNMNQGHKRSYTAILKTLAKMGHNTQILQKRINDLLVKSFMVCLPPIVQKYKAYQPCNETYDMCFHVLGADILLNQKCQPFLLQINHTPSFTTDTPLDRVIKRGVIQDTLRILNINLQKKKKIVEGRKALNSERLSKKIVSSLRQDNKKVNESISQQAKYEILNMGSYSRIFPTQSQILNEKYLNFFRHAQDLYQQKIGFRRKQPILPTINNCKQSGKQLCKSQLQQEERSEVSGLKLSVKKSDRIKSIGK